MNAKRLWIAGAGATGLGLLTLVGGAGTQPGAEAQMRQRCAEAARDITELRHEIQGIEGRLDKAQKAMASAAKGDAKVAAMEAVVNEMADERNLITQKTLAMQSLISGHVLEHLAAEGDVGKKTLPDCHVYKYLTSTASGFEKTATPTPKK
jgi:hypothetical protein